VLDYFKGVEVPDSAFKDAFVDACFVVFAMAFVSLLAQSSEWFAQYAFIVFCIVFWLRVTVSFWRGAGAEDE